MNEGFKVTCLKCGKETIFKQDGHLVETNNEVISVYATSYDGDIGIGCDCGNKTEEGHWR